MVVKKGSLLVGLALISLLPGCWGRKKATNHKADMNKEVALRTVDIPLVDNEIVAGSDISLQDESLTSFFDEDMEDFVAAIEQEEKVQEYARNENTVNAQVDDAAFAWADEHHEQVAEAFKTVYFDFDRHGVKADQKSIVEKDIEHARSVLAQARAEGVEPTIVIEGHSCHSAGSSAYNMALSEKRAKSVADFFVGEGVARENIKIVGRGKEVPAVVDGQVVTGDRDQQWLNRRVEVHVINS